MIERYASERFMEAFAIIEHQRKDWVEQTKHGLLFLVLGVLFSAVPIMRPVGSFLIVAGLVLLLEGRHAFGQSHFTHIIIGALLFAASAALFVVTSVGYIFLSFALTYEYPGDSALPLAMIQTVPTLLAIELSGSILAGTSYAVFTYRLQSWRERLLLWLGFAINIGTSVLIYSALNAAFASQVAPFWRGGWDIPGGRAFNAQLITWNLLNFVPAVAFAIAIYSTFSRLNVGDIQEQ